MANQRRMHKVAERIRSLVAMELQRVADPRLALVTVTSVVVSNDLRHAKIYWMASELPGRTSGGSSTERVSEVQEAFARAASFFRRAVAEDLGVRFAPELKFYHDDSVDARYTIDELFRKIKAESPVVAVDNDSLAVEEDGINDEDTVEDPSAA